MRKQEVNAVVYHTIDNTPQEDKAGKFNAETDAYYFQYYENMKYGINESEV